jgi:hypothetical protein
MPAASSCHNLLFQRRGGALVDLRTTVDVEQELQHIEEQDEDDRMHHHGRYAGPLVGELYGAFVTGDLEHQPW